VVAGVAKSSWLSRPASHEEQIPKSCSQLFWARSISVSLMTGLYAVSVVPVVPVVAIVCMLDVIVSWFAA